MKVKRNDWILLGVLIASLLVVIIVSLLLHRTGETVLVRHNGELLVSLPLSQDTDYLAQIDGHYNHIRIKNGSVFIDEADCPHKLCVKQGKIQYQGESIVCLPHQLVVEITGPITKDLDGITGGAP